MWEKNGKKGKKVKEKKIKKIRENIDIKPRATTGKRKW